MQWDEGAGLINNVGLLKGTYRYGKTAREILKSDDIYTKYLIKYPFNEILLTVKCSTFLS